MTLLSPAAARYYGRPVYSGEATTREQLCAMLKDIEQQATRIVDRGIVRVVVFEPPQREPE